MTADDKMRDVVQGLTVLEQNALRWVLLCQSLKVNPTETEVSDIFPLIEERVHKRDLTRTGRH